MSDVLFQGALGAAGLAGSLVAGDSGGVSPSDLPGTGFSSDTDSLQSQLEILSLINLGASAEQVVPQGGPAMSLLNAIGTGAAGDIRQEGQGIVAQVVGAVNREVDAVLRSGGTVDQAISNLLADPFIGFNVRQFWITQPLGVTGFGSFEDLVRAEFSFTQNRNEQVSQLEALIPDVRAGQAAAIQGASQILQDFPVPTQANIDALSESFTEDIVRQRRQQANVGGFPVDLRNVGREGQQQAIELLTGKQTIAGNALNAFLGSQSAALESGLNVATQGQAGALGAAQLTSAQAIALTNANSAPATNGVAQTSGLLGALGIDALLNNENLKDSLPNLLDIFSSGGPGTQNTGTTGDTTGGPFGF